MGNDKGGAGRVSAGRAAKITPAQIALERNAREMGKNAFATGQNRIPAQNVEFSRWLFDQVRGKPVGTASPLLDAFNRGYTEASLAEPIPGMEEFYATRPRG